MSRQTKAEQALTWEDRPIVPVGFQRLPEDTLRSYLYTLKHILTNMLREHAALPQRPRFGRVFGRWYTLNTWIEITRLDIHSLERFLRSRRTPRKSRRARRGQKPRPPVPPKT